MKKTLVALAALAATSSVFAMGHAAAGSSVTLYGRIDAAVVTVDKANANNQRITSLGDSTMATSIWGLRGSEDLGGGLRGTFNIEGDVQTTNGQTSAAGVFRRAANVGLEGGFGSLTLGTRLNPLIASWAGMQVASTNSVFVTSSAAAGFADFFTKNAITYTSPKLANLVTVQVQHGLSNTAGAAQAGSMTSFNITAAPVGPVELRAAYQDQKASASTTASNTTGLNKKTTLLGAKGLFGPATAGLILFKNEVSTFAAPGTKTIDVEGYQLSGSYSLSKQVLLAASYTNFDSQISGQGKSSLTNLQARYIFSPRTTAYFQVGASDNAASGIAVSPVWTVAPGVANKKQNAVGAGVVHTF